MPEVRYNLLTEPLLGVELADGHRASLSLPAVLAHLGTGELELRAIQAHQQHAVHAFLVQLAAIALHHGGESGPALPEERWRALLRARSGGMDEPWCLYVEYLSMPAFMQPPVHEGSLDLYRGERVHPDELDVLVTAKNHDVKASRISRPRPEHWVYALISLQTMQGYSGKLNYGISRMNGGYGSRPCIAMAPSERSGERFRRDVRLWRDRRPILLDMGYKEDGPALLWLEPWDGITSPAFRTCDPFYIEICRRVRLLLEDGGLRGLQAPSQAGRLEAEAAKGDTGDLWTPVNVTEHKAFTASSQGLRYNDILDLLTSGDFQSPACELRGGDAGDQTAWAFIGRVLVRGNKTEGFHERVFPVPARVRRRLGNREGRTDLHARGQKRIERAGVVQNKVLYPALMTLLAAGEDEPRLAKDRSPGRFTQVYSRKVDQVFFAELWRSLEMDEATARLRWDRELRKLAREALKEAIHSVPLPAARREKAIARAELRLERAARNLMTDLYSVGAIQDERSSSIV